MFAKSIFEPVEDSRELNKREKGGCKFFVSSADSAITFDSAKEVFDSVPAPIKARVERPFSFATTTAWYAVSPACLSNQMADMVRIKTFVSDQGAASQAADVNFDRFDIVAAAAMKAERDRSSQAIH